ncbi:MAG: hypothetical protein LBI72_12875 [Flavobacteriaceae bacterium]|jgi:hypothetical protein|nr:hypothetical protein [Flavobacteriaceae bacterium]
MKKTLCAFALILISTIGFIACEKDDICGKEEPTTPSFLIEFYDFDDQNVGKTNLVEAYVAGREEDLIKSSGNKLRLPLKLDQPETEWILQTSQVINNQTVVVKDTLTYKYIVNTHYLNRACGYVSTFSLKQDGSSPTLNGQTNIFTGNWIKHYITQTNEIVDETQAHFKIYY